jgi:2-dehydro-3-deoxyglucarate aldolase
MVSLPVKNNLKKMIKEGKVVIGAPISIGNPIVAEVIGHLGFDWVFFDLEHSPMTLETLQVMMQAMSFSETTPIVRVASNDPVPIKQALDIGAYGIIVPMVNSLEDAKRAVASVRYPPLGIRGFGPRRAALADPDYVVTANEEILLMIQIESQQAIDNIDEILSVKGIDVAVFGPNDLSMSLGVFTKFDDPKFVSAVQKVKKSANRHGVALSMLGSSAFDARKLVEEGFKILVVRDDLGTLRNAELSALQAIRKSVSG